MNRYLISYESAHWCGGDALCVVYAPDAYSAELIAEDHMETEMREFFNEEYSELENEDECAYSVISIEPFGELHPQWKHFINPSQTKFYPEVNKPSYDTSKYI